MDDVELPPDGAGYPASRSREASPGYPTVHRPVTMIALGAVSSPGLRQDLVITQSDANR